MTRKQSHHIIIHPSLLFIGIYLLCILFFSCQSQKNRSPSRDNFDFPKDWMGNWKGEIQIYDHSGLKQSLHMGLNIHPTDTANVYTWIIQYGEDTINGKRDYLLRTINDTLGHYQIDERNSILIDAYHIDDRLLSEFEVLGNEIHSSYRLEEDKMIFEITVSQKSNVKSSGDSVVKGDSIPEVLSFPITGLQKAVLEKD